MDPLSIASTVVALTATCLSTCKKLSDLAGSYEDVPVVIAMLCSESTVISCALSQLQILILQRDDLAQAWATKTDILDAFEMSLNGCMIVFSCLEAETRQLQTQMPVSTGLRFLTKIRFMWNQDRLKELLTALRGQQMSINFLLQVLECKTLSDIQKNVQANQSRIRASISDAQSVRSRNPSIRTGCNSVFDNDTHRLSMFADDLISIAIAPSELEFEFDNFVINSQAYRRVFAKAQAQNSQQVHVQNITGDLIDLSESIHDQDADTIRNVHSDLAELDFSQRRSSVSSIQRTPPPTPPIPRKPVSNLDVPPSPSLRTSSPATTRPKGTRTCFKCDEVLTGQFVRALDHTWHLDCFTCADCDKVTAHKFFISKDVPGAPLCVTDYFRRLDLLCFKCGEALRGNYITAAGKKFHQDHFTCEKCDYKFGKEDSYYEHDEHILCFNHYCREYAQRCKSCRWPILKQFVEFSEGPLVGSWHPECYLLRKHLNISIPPTRTTQQFLESFKEDSCDSAAIQAHSEKLEVMIKHTWEWTSMFLEVVTGQATGVQEASSRKFLDVAFRHWNTMTDLLSSLLLAVHEAFHGVTDQDLGLLRATFVADEQGFLSQVVRGMELSRVVTTAVGPLLQRTLWKLLLDENWPEEDSRLHTFLGRLLDAQQMSPLPQYSERAPEVSDQRSLECSVCSQIVRDDAYVLATNHEPGCRKWHKKCFGCQFCAAGPDKQSLSTVQTDLESSTRLTCNGCDRYSVVKEMVNCELLVESIWVSWARARRQMEASKVPRLPELPFR